MTPGEVENGQNESMPSGLELELMAYLDGELEPERVVELEARLASDANLAARVRELEAIGDFLRDDADRLYGPRVDAIVDDVMARVQGVSPAVGLHDERPRLEAVPRSEIAPPTSRLTRTKKNTVIWVAFGTVAAAAAALVLYVRSTHDTPVAKTPPAAPMSSSAEKVAVVNTASPVPSQLDPVPIIAPAAVSTVQVEDLEVGQGATVIYTREGEGSSAVVWINGREREGAK